MHSIVLVGSREFSSFAPADQFYDVLEAQGFEYISTLFNVPHAGMYTVRWGHYEVDHESADRYEMRMIAKIWAERESEAADEFTALCNRDGRLVAARQFAAAAGYTGRDADVFCAGFEGVNAKSVNPRAEGREPIFREGRAAWGSKEGQRAWRVESVRARSIRAPVLPAPFNPGCGLIANGEY